MPKPMCTNPVHFFYVQTALQADPRLFRDGLLVNLYESDLTMVEGMK